MTNQATSDEHLHLLALLSEQHELYTRLRALAERQRELICGERPEDLLNILRDRQGLVTALARLNDDLAPFRRNWDETYAGLPAHVRAEASKLLADISGLLRAILRTDQEDSALLSARKQIVARELAEVDQTQAAASAYGRSAAVANAPSRSALQSDLAG